MPYTRWQIASVPVILYTFTAEAMSWAVFGFARAFLVVNIYVWAVSPFPRILHRHCVTSVEQDRLVSVQFPIRTMRKREKFCEFLTQYLIRIVIKILCEF